VHSPTVWAAANAHFRDRLREFNGTFVAARLLALVLSLYLHFVAKVEGLGGRRPWPVVLAASVVVWLWWWSVVIDVDRWSVVSGGGGQW
jgi:hypothetical protein